MSDGGEDLPPVLRDLPEDLLPPLDEAVEEPWPPPDIAPPLPPPAPAWPPAWRGWAVFGGSLIVTFLLGMLGASIIQRREEARERPPLEPIRAMETDSSRWGADFPREYDSYLRMQDDTTRTRYGGSFPRDYLAETPANVILFAGYGFAKEYRQARGHVYSVTDVTQSERVGPQTPATCWTCKSADVPRLLAGAKPKDFYALRFSTLAKEITHPIGCLDCHEPNTMELRIARPALREALEQQGRDVEKASHQEMRSLLCAQCHVEYYFEWPGNYLTLPWDKGTSPEQMESHYDAAKFADWIHAVSKARMIKIQHPDYELYRTGIHAYRNVACADCHMPYRSEGGVKFSDHHVQSPLLDLTGSCLVCHRWSEAEIRSRVEDIQDKVHGARELVEKTLSLAHFDVAAAMQAGANEDELAAVRGLIRKAQLRWDYVAASNGMGFHAPQECMRILAAALDLAGQCRLECAHILAAHGVAAAVKYPDFSSKDSAQKLIKQFVDGNPPKLF